MHRFEDDEATKARIQYLQKIATKFADSYPLLASSSLYVLRNKIRREKLKVLQHIFAKNACIQ